MPPHLHPHSNATTTLFAGTLLASFIAVGLPHVFPCPRPRKGYADSERQLDADGKPRRRKRRKALEEDTSSASSADSQSPESREHSKGNPIREEAALFKQLKQEAQVLEKEARECPVPKPGGLLGELLGFREGRRKGSDEQRPGG